jgi:hypothetical protein
VAHRPLASKAKFLSKTHQVLPIEGAPPILETYTRDRCNLCEASGVRWKIKIPIPVIVQERSDEDCDQANTRRHVGTFPTPKYEEDSEYYDCENDVQYDPGLNRARWKCPN